MLLLTYLAITLRSAVRKFEGNMHNYCFIHVLLCSAYYLQKFWPVVTVKLQLCPVLLEVRVLAFEVRLGWAQY